MHLTIESYSQSLIQQRYLALKDNVSVQYGDRLQLTAPELFFDTKTHAAWGQGSAKQPLRLHHGDLWYAAEHVRVNVAGQTGTLTKATVSGCDAVEPHWSLHVGRASLSPDWVTARDISFRIGNVPIFYLPWIQLPVDGRLAGTTLFPKLSYDQRQGLGVDYHLQYNFKRKTSVRTGVQWRTKRGVVWQNRLRSHRDAAHTAELIGWYGRDCGRSEYWLTGDVVYEGKSELSPCMVMKGSLGSDKRVSQKFFHEYVGSDEITNSATVARWKSPVQQIDCSVRQTRLMRDIRTTATRSVPQAAGGKEIYTVSYLPQVQWYRGWASEEVPLRGSLWCGGDVVVARSQDEVQQEMGRLWGYTSVSCDVGIPRGTMQISVRPYAQGRVFGRSKSYIEPGSNLVSGVDGSIVCRETFFSVKGVSLDNMVKVERYGGDLDRHSHAVDEHERYDSGYVIGDTMTTRWRGLELSASQSISMGWMLSEKWIAGRAPLGFLGVRPLKIRSRVAGRFGHLQSEHEYNWLTDQFCFHDLSFGTQLGPLELCGSVTHCDPENARKKKIFFDGGTFVSCALKCYHGRYLRWWLESSWAYEAAHKSFHGLRHEAGLAYRGHCWEFSAGYRQERSGGLDHHEIQRSWFIKVCFDAMGTLGTTLNHQV